MKYQWVLFDADDTLFHFDNFSGLKRMFRRYSVTFEKDDFHDYQNINKPLLGRLSKWRYISEQVGVAKPDTLLGAVCI